MFRRQDTGLSDGKKIVDLGAARRARELAERAAAKRAARPPGEGIRPALYGGVVVVLIFARAGGYTLIAAL